MHGTFNGVQITRITSLTTDEPTLGITRTTFRVTEGPLQQLEQRLELNGPALLILSDKQIEGRIVHYSADLHHGYDDPMILTASSVGTFPLRYTRSPEPPQKSALVSNPIDKVIAQKH
jgi:hypothetical protein